MVSAVGVVVSKQKAGTGCSLTIEDRGGVVAQLCAFVRALLPVLRFPRLFKFLILGHCLSPAPRHTHHAIQVSFPGFANLKPVEGFQRSLSVLFLAILTCEA